MVLRFSNPLQRHNLLTREIRYSNHFRNGISLCKHILGGSFQANANASFLASSNTSGFTLFLSISQCICMVTETLHITFVIHKLLVSKIRNSRNLKKTFEHHFPETLGHLVYLVCVLENEKQLVKIAPAFLR
ncbi:hypothetical protein R83H12_00338 [Fibrobacteria bacterium R8-3-H12]